MLAFCSSDDVSNSDFQEKVGPTGGGGHSDMLAPPRVGPTSSPEQKAKKAKSHAELTNLGYVLHSCSGLCVCWFFCFVSMVLHGCQMGSLLCLFFLLF